MVQGSRRICGHKTGFVHLRNGGIGRAPAYIPVGDCPGKDGGGELRGAVDLHVQALCGQLQALKLVLPAGTILHPPCGPNPGQTRR